MRKLEAQTAQQKMMYSKQVEDLEALVTRLTAEIEDLKRPKDDIDEVADDFVGRMLESAGN